MSIEAYNSVAYINTPYSHTHPSRLHVLARLHGLDAPPVETCRVLEMGASEGLNLIGMAVALPKAQFTGVELAPDPVVRGNQRIADLGLTNVRLLEMDLLDLDSTFGEFDYIVAHGLYTWTPPVVSERILAIARANLHPKGVAFISYNVLPGGVLRGAFRNMMLYHAGHIADPVKRLSEARRLLNLFVHERPTPDSLDVAISAQAQALAARTDSALCHDELADCWAPLYFHDFVAQASAAGLTYLDDSACFDSNPINIDQEAIAAVQAISGGDWLKEQQYLDFLRSREFRQSILCHSENQVSHRWQPERVAGCYAVSGAQEKADGAFMLDSGSRLTADERSIEYLRRTIARWPETLEVTAEDALLAAELYRIGALDLHGFQGAAARAGSRPLASPLARYQMARREPFLTTLWHEPLMFSGDQASRMLSLLDGKHDRRAIAEAMECPLEVIDDKLAELSYLSLMLS